MAALRLISRLLSALAPLSVLIIWVVTPAYADGAIAPGGDEAKPNYGRAPDSVIPYRQFADPYAHFFDEIIPFYGTGREKAKDHETARIGYLGPVPPAVDHELGQYTLEGVQLAFDQANAEGGYNGTLFEIVERPDLGLWGATSNEMAAFRYEDNALAVIGSIDGANTHIALRVALKTQTAMVNTGDSDPTLTETNIPWLLRCMADDRQQGYALAHHVYRERGIKSVVAFRVNDRFGRTGMMEFRDAAQRLGFPLRAELRWNRGEREFDQQLDRIEKIGPEAVVLWGTAADVAAVVKAIRGRGLMVELFGCDRQASQAFLDAAGEAAEGMAVAASYDPTRNDARLTEFVKAYQERFGRAPETFAAHGYDGARILIDAIRTAGLNRARIRDALYEYREYVGVTGPIEFDATLNDVGPVYIATVRDGRLVYREMTYASAPSMDHGRPYRRMTDAAPKAKSPVRGAASPEEIRIGCFLPLDEKGKQVVRGVEQALANDRERYPQGAPIRLLVSDSRGAWGRGTTGLVDMVTKHDVVALLGSTERKGTHLAETLAAKLHFPILSLCGSDPSITAIPIPWVFCVSPRAGSSALPADADSDFVLGYDAAALLASCIREGGHTRKELRDTLAGDNWFEGRSGTFRFDALGNRVDITRGIPEGR